MPFFKSDNGLMFLIETTFVIAPQSNKELHQKNLHREGEEKAKSAGYKTIRIARKQGSNNQVQKYIYFLQIAAQGDNAVSAIDDGHFPEGLKMKSRVTQM